MPSKIIHIANIGLKGLNTDMASWDLPPEFITSGKNFRVFANKLISAGASKQYADLAIDINAGHVFHARTTGTSYWMVFGETSVHVYDGTNFYNISSKVYNLGVEGELKWTADMLGNIPVVNNPGSSPEYWSPPGSGQPLQSLPFDVSNTWEDLGHSCEVLRVHKNFIFALDLNEGAVEYPSAYRWSHPADINGIPFSWDETANDTIAGRAQIGGDSGRIIDGRSLRDSFVIYAENAVHILDPSNDAFVWNRREMVSTTGLMSRNALVVVKGQQFFLGDGDILRNDGNRIQSIAHNRIRTRLNSQINAEFYYRSYAVRNDAYKEIWFCIPEGTSENPNVAYVYNWMDDAWSIQEIPNTIRFANYGPITPVPLTYDNVIGSYNDSKLSYESQSRTPLNDTIIGIHSTADVGDSDKLIILDPWDTSSSIIGNTNAVIERTNFALEGHDQVNTITRVYPHMEGAQPVNIQIGAQAHANAPVLWENPVLFDPNTDRKVDVRSTGELHCWRIFSEGTGNWAMSGMDIEYTPSGKR